MLYNKKMITLAILCSLQGFCACSNNSTNPEESPSQDPLFIFTKDPISITSSYEFTSSIQNDQIVLMVNEKEACALDHFSLELDTTKLSYAFEGNQLIIHDFESGCLSKLEGGSTSQLEGSYTLIDISPLPGRSENDCALSHSEILKLTWNGNKVTRSVTDPQHCWATEAKNEFESAIENNVKLSTQGCNTIAYQDSKGNVATRTALKASSNFSEWSISYNNKSCVMKKQDIQLNEEICANAYADYLKEDGQSEYYFHAWIPHSIESPDFYDCLKDLELPEELAEAL